MCISKSYQHSRIREDPMKTNAKATRLKFKLFTVTSYDILKPLKESLLMKGVRYHICVQYFKHLEYLKINWQS